MRAAVDEAIDGFDALNATDPTRVETEHGATPKQLLYARRMTAQLATFAPDASDALKLAARAQHLCRWQVARADYPTGRKGYLRWRRDAAAHHARLAAEVMREVGLPDALIERTSNLITKRRLKTDPEAQALEDVACLVFLRYEALPFFRQHPKEKVIDIVNKTWAKMSARGRQAALGIELEPEVRAIVDQVLSSESNT